MYGWRGVMFSVRYKPTNAISFCLAEMLAFPVSGNFCFWLAPFTWRCGRDASNGTAPRAVCSRERWSSSSWAESVDANRFMYWTALPLITHNSCNYQQTTCSFTQLPVTFVRRFSSSIRLESVFVWNKKSLVHCTLNTNCFRRFCGFYPCSNAN